MNQIAMISTGPTPISKNENLEPTPSGVVNIISKYVPLAKETIFHLNYDTLSKASRC